MVENSGTSTSPIFLGTFATHRPERDVTAWRVKIRQKVGGVFWGLNNPALRLGTKTRKTPTLGGAREDHQGCMQQGWCCMQERRRGQPNRPSCEPDGLHLSLPRATEAAAERV